jgi:DNA polymerase-3 subunit alpha
MSGDIGHALANGNVALAEKLAADWARRFPGGFYIEIQRAGHPGTESYIRDAVQIASRLACRWWRPTRSSSPGARTSRPTRPGCASPRATCLPTSAGPKDFTEEQYFKSQAEMCALFADSPRRSRTVSRSPAAAR